MEFVYFSTGSRSVLTKLLEFRGDLIQLNRDRRQGLVEAN